MSKLGFFFATALLLADAPGCKTTGSKDAKPGTTPTTSNAEHCSKLGSWDRCAKDKRCMPVRFTHHRGYKGPSWACNPAPGSR